MELDRVPVEAADADIEPTKGAKFNFGIRTGMIAAEMFLVREKPFAPDFREPRGHTRVFELGYHQP